MMDCSDNEIIRRVQAGNTDLFHVIFERHFSRIDAFVCRCIKDDEARKDVVAEVFVRAFQSVQQFDLTVETPYLVYLYTISRNLVVDYARRARIEAYEDEPAGAEGLESEPPPLHSMLRREAIVRVREALLKLPAEHRQIIHLAFDEDLSSRDIAHIMNKPSITSVTSHLYRAMQALRKTLLADGYFSDLAEKEGAQHVRTRKSG